MTPATTITIIRGTDNTIQVTLTQANGSPIDLTGATVFFTVKSADSINETDSTDAQAVIKKTYTNIPNPTAGIVNIALSNSDTDITSGNYLYDIKLKTSTGAMSAISAGAFDITDAVTNRTA